MEGGELGSGMAGGLRDQGCRPSSVCAGNLGLSWPIIASAHGTPWPRDFLFLDEVCYRGRLTWPY